MVKKSLWIAVILLILSGCDKQENVGAVGSLAWERMPEVPFGVLESEKLSEGQWNSGRAEETSKYALCEAEKGYYLLYSGCLYYADKASPENWVPVCKDPDCAHQGTAPVCSAMLHTDRMIAKDGRIYFSGEIRSYPHLYSGEAHGRALFSVSPDGSDIQLEHYIKEGLLSDGGMAADNLHSRYWIYLVSKMDPSGEVLTSLFVTDQEGTHTHLQDMKGDKFRSLLTARSMAGLFGEEAFYFDHLEPAGFFTVRDGALSPVRLPDRPANGGYLSESSLRYFVRNEGYYDYDLDSGEEVWIAPSRVENSDAEIILPNLIVESTLFYRPSAQERPSGIEHRMEIFDGEQWHSVQLPEALLTSPEDFFISVRGITSDAIWFSSEKGELKLYRVGLGSDDWTLEHFATIQRP